MKIRSILLGSLLSLAAATSHASQTVTYTTDFVGGIGTVQFNLPKFDPGLFGGAHYQLTGVTVFFEGGDLSGSFSVTAGSNSVTVSSGQYNLQAIPISSDTGFSFSATNYNFSIVGGYPQTVAANTTDIFDVAADQTIAYNEVVIDSSFFSTYTGPTSQTVNFESQITPIIGLSGTGGSFDAEDVTGTLRYGVTYTYIPEPTTALLGGLGMLVLLRRRR